MRANGTFSAARAAESVLLTQIFMHLTGRANALQYEDDGFHFVRSFRSKKAFAFNRISFTVWMICGELKG